MLGVSEKIKHLAVVDVLANNQVVLENLISLCVGEDVNNGQTNNIKF